MNLRAWGARHAQTLVGSLGRLAHAPLATAMTLGVIAMALALPLLLAVFLQNGRTATARWNQAFDVSVYVQKRTGPAHVQALARQIRTRSDVAGVRIIEADDALREFKRTSGFGDALDALDGNPLPDTLIVTPTAAAANPLGVEALRGALGRLADVQAVQIDAQWVSRLQAILAVAKRIVLLADGLLACGVMLVVGNTIRLDILNRRTEIEVMKLVGATDGFARRPFLYTGMLYGAGGALLAVLLVALTTHLLTAPVEALARSYGSDFKLEFVGFGGVAALVAGALALSWLGSWLVATRHIRAIEPA